MARRLFCEISPLTYRISLAKGIWLRRFKNWRSNEQFATYHKEKKLGVLVYSKLVAGVGGGLCNLANTLHLLVMNSPMTVTEVHPHSSGNAKSLLQTTGSLKRRTPPYSRLAAPNVRQTRGVS